MLLILLGLISSVILSFTPIEQACGQDDNGCYAVQASEYESTLGIKNAHIGLVAFTGLFLLTFWHEKRPAKKKKQFIALGLTLGSIIAIYFIYLQFFVINAICKYCMVTDLGLLLALGVFYFVKDKKNKEIHL